MDSVPKRGRIIRSSEKTLIANTYNYCEDESNNLDLVIPLSRPTERAACYWKVSLKAVAKIKNEMKSTPSGVLGTPGKNRKRLKYKKAVIDDFDRRIMRGIIKSFYINNPILSQPVEK